MILIAMALETARPPIADWQPFSMQRTPDGGLFDRTTAKRTGALVNAWVRLVNVHLDGVNKADEQTDLRMEFDCLKPIMRIIAYRVVRPDGTVLKEVEVSPRDAKWRPLSVGMRSADARSALCGRVR